MDIDSHMAVSIDLGSFKGNPASLLSALKRALLIIILLAGSSVRPALASLGAQLTALLRSIPQILLGVPNGVYKVYSSIQP